MMIIGIYCWWCSFLDVCRFSVVVILFVIVRVSSSYVMR